MAAIAPLDRSNVLTRHQSLPRAPKAFAAALGLATERPHFLGATSQEEQIYTEWVASQIDASVGQVVDLGSWLGSLTCSLARGLQANPTAQARLGTGPLIDAYDLFTWHPGFDGWVAGTPLEGRYRLGDDYLPAFREHTAAYADLIRPHAAELTSERWSGGPIALLVNDVWKTLPLAQGIARNFFPTLIPDQALLLHQDYLWCTESFIQWIMYRLRDYFMPVFQVPNGTTVCFMRTTTPLPEVLPIPATMEGVEAEEITAAFAWSASFLDDVARSALPLAEAGLLAEAGHLEAARQAAQKVFTMPEFAHGYVQWQLAYFKTTPYGVLLA